MAILASSFGTVVQRPTQRPASVVLRPRSARQPLCIARAGPADLDVTITPAGAYQVAKPVAALDEAHMKALVAEHGTQSVSMVYVYHSHLRWGHDKFGPIMDRLAEQYREGLNREGLNVFKVQIGNFHGSDIVKSVPAVFVYKNGSLVEMIQQKRHYSFIEHAVIENVISEGTLELAARRAMSAQPDELLPFNYRVRKIDQQRRQLEQVFRVETPDTQSEDGPVPATTSIATPQSTADSTAMVTTVVEGEATELLRSRLVARSTSERTGVQDMPTSVRKSPKWFAFKWFFVCVACYHAAQLSVGAIAETLQN